MTVPSLPVIIGVSILAVATIAQAQPVVTPGARIRLVQSESRQVAHIGTFMRLSGDTLALQDERAVVRTISMVGYQVEVGGGRHRHALAGALIGAGVGLAVGLVVSANLDSELCDLPDVNGRCVLQDVEDAARTGVIVIGAGAGAIVGAVIGLIPHERWSPAVLQPQVSFSPITGGWRLGFKLTR